VIVTETNLPGVVEITPKKFGDHRGFFSETFNARALESYGIHINWVQDNHSWSAKKGVLRGLHFQLPPCAQDKLVRVTRGAVLDVVADIRRDSESYGKWVSVELSAEKWNQLLVPKGFAHGFVTLSDDVEMIYKVSQFYSPEHDRSVRFDDPALGIDWQVDFAEITLSEKDANAPLLHQSDNSFTLENC